MSDLNKAIAEAEKELNLALSHVTKARDGLAQALGVDPTQRPEIDVDMPTEQWRGTRLLQNTMSAHFHIDDRYGS
jgi:hypothetical protein